MSARVRSWEIEVFPKGDKQKGLNFSTRFSTAPIGTRFASSGPMAQSIYWT